jgi:signal transduction histidine kinase
MAIAGRLTLGTRIALLVALGLALTLSLFGFLSLRSLQASSQRELNERLMAAQLSASHVDNFLNLYLDMLSRSVDSEGDDLLSGDTASARRLLEQIYSSGVSMGRAIYLFDRTGDLTWAEPESTRTGPQGPELRAAAARVVESGRSNVSEAYRDPLGRELVSMAVPVLNRNVVPAGALVLELDLTGPLLHGFVQPILLGRTGYVEIVDGKGTVLASSDKSRFFQKSDHTDQFAEMIRVGRPTVGGCHSCHQGSDTAPLRPDVLAFAPLSTAPWGVAIRQSEEEVLTPTRELEHSLMVVAALLLLTSLVAAGLGTHILVRPLRELTSAARRIAGGDLESRLRSSGPAEIGELAREFDGMREKLRASVSSLEQVKASLEQRVDQRTRQLSALLGVSKVLASTLDLRPLLEAVSARTGEVLELADGGLIALFDERSGRLGVRASWGYGHAVRMISFEPGEGACGQAYQWGRPVLLEGREAVEESMCSISPENRAWLTQARHHQGVATSLMALPLIVKGRTIGAMMIKHSRGDHLFSGADLRLAQALADQVAVAVENARLYQEVLEKERMRGLLLDKVIVAQEEERRRIARELHDDTCQSLAALGISLEDVEEKLPETAEAARMSLGRLKEQVRGTLREVRTLALNLRPSMLDDLGLVMAIDWYAKEQLPQKGLEVKLDLDGVQGRLTPSMETELFRITQEALTNVVKHSGASLATVRMRLNSRSVLLEVEDDGLGFDVERTLGPSGPRHSLGLHSMRERTALSGGSFRVLSSPGQGTMIRVELPIQGANGSEH